MPGAHPDGGVAVVDAEPLVEGLRRRAHRLHPEEELVGDLREGAAGGEKAQDVDLTRGERDLPHPSAVAQPHAGLLGDHGLEDADDAGAHGLGKERRDGRVGGPALGVGLHLGGDVLVHRGQGADLVAGGEQCRAGRGGRDGHRPAHQVEAARDVLLEVGRAGLDDERRLGGHRLPDNRLARGVGIALAQLDEDEASPQPEDRDGALVGVDREGLGEPLGLLEGDEGEVGAAEGEGRRPHEVPPGDRQLADGQLVVETYSWTARSQRHVAGTSTGRVPRRSRRSRVVRKVRSSA